MPLQEQLGIPLWLYISMVFFETFQWLYMTLYIHIEMLYIPKHLNMKVRLRRFQNPSLSPFFRASEMSKVHFGILGREDCPLRGPAEALGDGWSMVELSDDKWSKCYVYDYLITSYYIYIIYTDTAFHIWLISNRDSKGFWHRILCKTAWRRLKIRSKLQALLGLLKCNAIRMVMGQWDNQDKHLT